MTPSSSLLVLAGTAAYTAWLGHRAFRRRPGFASWHMFAGVRQASFHLERSSRAGVAFNPWDHLPHSELKFSAAEIPHFLEYLIRAHGLDDLHGTIVVRDGRQLTTVRVEGTHAVG
ncbi:hypothetical protein ACWF95_37465 [Streptomyces vinaceus]